MLRFGPFQFDAASGELRKHGLSLRLQGKTLHLLQILVSRPVEMVTRAELQNQLWPGATSGDFEHGLNSTVNRLRQTLGDAADQPRYIETLPGRGYRFIAPVERPAVTALEPVPPALRPPQFSALRRIAVAVPLMVLTGVGLASWVSRELKVSGLETKGEMLVAKWTEEDVRKGIKYYENAIAIDPNSVESHQGLAVGWLFLSDLHASPRETMPKAKAAILKAIELDSASSAAHVTLGVIRTSYDWDWAAAERDFQRAIQLEPDDAPAHQMYGWLLAGTGRFAEARTAMQRSIDIDSLNSWSYSVLGLTEYLAHEYDAAIENFRRARGLDPNSYWPHMLLGWAHVEKREFALAIEEIERAVSLQPGPQTLASLAFAQAAAGRGTEARRLLLDLARTAQTRYVSPYDVAPVYAALGDDDQALAYLEKAYEDRCGWLAFWAKADPRFDRLRSDNRFQALLKRVGHLP